MYATLFPYQKEGFKEQHIFKLDFEEEGSDSVDLEREIEEVEKQRAYWDRVDNIESELEWVKM